jgi:sulfide:quinone oxidoreductase
MQLHKKIVIIGGGVAALETAIGLHDSPNVEVDVTMVSPQREFHYRPFAVLEPFGFHQYAKMSIADLVEGCNVELVHDKVSRVDLTFKRVVLAEHPLIGFDALVVATGAGQIEAVRGAATIGGAESTKQIQHLLGEIDSGLVHRVAFVAPPGASWTLPIYEFALLTAARAKRQLHPGLHVIVATPERRPLDVFGDEASDRVVRMLNDAGVELRTSVRVQSFCDGVLTTVPEKEIEVDRVIALPHLVGRRIPGLPHDANGFLPIDRHGHVADTSDVYAAGDIADFPVKQGSIAAQQADAVVASIASRFGSQQDAPEFHPQLHAVLFSEHGRTFLRAADHGGPHGDAAVSEEPLWEDAEKIFSKHLSQRMRRLRATEMKMATR